MMSSSKGVSQELSFSLETRRSAAGVVSPKKIGKRFKLVRRLWGEQKSHVFEVRDRILEKDLALRLLNWTEDQRAIARFKQEFRLLSDLRHPNIVRVHDFEVVRGDCYFFTMDLCPGQFLHNYFQPCDFKKLIQVAWEICQTLDFIHSRGIILGNLTPRSMLVAEPPQEVDSAAYEATDLRLGFVTLGMETELKLTETEVPVWLHYLPPEAAMGRAVDLRANLYSLGVILYELMTGARPFEAETTTELVKQHLRRPPPPPRQLRSDVPLELENIVLKLLEKRPSRRYQTAHEVAAALSEVSSYIIGEQTRPFQANFVFSSEFVGRKKEFSSLEKAYRAYRQGRGSMVLVTGEAGIGKTRLLEEFRLFLQLEGEVVLHTRSFRRARSPYQEINELVGQLLHRFEESQPQLVENYRKEMLGPLLAAGRSSSDTEAVSPSSQRQVLEQLTDVFLQFSTGHPYVITLDDLQLADDETIEFLTGLAARLHNHAILLLLVFEGAGTEASPALGALLEMAKEGPLTGPVELDRLSKDETGQLLQSLLGLNYQPPRMTKMIHQETEGNPFFVEELIKYLADERIIELRGDDWDLQLPDLDLIQVPGSIIDTITKRLESLEELELEILKTMAVFSQGIELELLSEVSGHHPEQLQSALLELQNRQLVAVEDRSHSPKNLFSHTKIGEVIYQKLDPMLRRLLHVRFAEILISRHSGDSGWFGAIAHHCLEGRLSRRAIEWGIRAARTAAELFAFQNSINYYERVIEEIEAQGRERYFEEYLEVLEKAGDIYARGGDSKKAILHYGKLLRERLPLTQRARIELKVGRCNLMSSKFEQALRHFKICLDDLADQGETEHLARLYTEIGRAEAFRGNVRISLENTVHALQLLSDTPDAYEVGELNLLMAFCNVALGMASEAIEHVREALRLFEKHDDLLNIGKALGIFGQAYEVLGQSALVNDYSEKALRLFERINFRYGQAAVYTNWGAALYRLTSDWDKAWDLLSKGSQLSKSIGDQHGVSEAELFMALMLLDRGLIADGRAQLARCRTALEKMGSVGWVAHVHIGQGYAHLRQGEWPSAMAELGKAYTIFSDCGLERAAGEARLLQAEVSLMSGQIGDTTKMLDEIEPTFEARHNMRELACSLRLRGLVELTSGRHGSGLDLLRRAERIGKDLGCEPELGKVYVALSLYYSQTHDNRQAIETLKKAEHIFKALGASSLLEDVERRVANLQEETATKLRRPEDPSEDIYQLYRISQLISPILDYKLLTTRILELSLESVQAERGLLISAAGVDGNYEIVASHGYRDEELEAFSSSIVGRVLEEGRPLLSTQTDGAPLATTLSLEVLDIHSVLCVPLTVGDRSEAALYLTSSSEGKLFCDRDLDLLSAIANHASVALRNVGLYERYKSIMEGIGVGIIVVDHGGRVRDFSRDAEKILGISESEILGQMAAAELDRRTHSELGSVLATTFARGETVHRELPYRRSGEVQGGWLDITTSLLHDGYGETIGVTAVIEEVTKVKRLRAELELSRRLAAMGQLAAQVAHRMKNLLSGIKILSQGLRRECEDGTEESTYVDEILRVVGGAESYTYEQLNFSSSSSEEEVVGISELIQEVASANATQIARANLELDLSIDPAAPKMCLKRKQVVEGLQGVLQNAIAASAPGQSIRFECRYEKDVKPELGEATARGQVVIEIEDHGVGIPPDQLGRVFDPFFTTKPGAAGVGLWLFHRMVQSLRGHVQVESEIGRGTIMKCIFPVPAEGRWEQLVQDPIPR